MIESCSINSRCFRLLFSAFNLKDACYVSLQNQLLIFSGFVVFEVCVGIFWPALGTLRGKYVLEASKFLLDDCSYTQWVNDLLWCDYCRSFSHNLLHVPFTTTAIGRKAFSFAAPTVRNSTPLSMRQLPSIGSFKRHLKTHLSTLPG